jgi:hypothetical protein
MGINSFPPAGGSSGYEFPSELIDPVSKFRISQPENLIDTDFEYGLQPTKWETVELINNTPSFFSKSGDTTIDGISSIITNAGTREIIVKTELDHGLAVGIPINVTGTKSITADGSYIINSIPDTKTFTYLCKDDQDETASILDLYSSIITGEFFQGSQLRVSDSEGIITDAAGTSQLTVTTNSTHGFGENTPFYFLNLNSTVAQEFQAANTASKTFDASNSATAQTFDGSNTLSSFNIDWSNSAVEGGVASNITSTDTANSRITATHQPGENFAGLPLGTPLYYSISAVSGYFNTNPRGVVFLKTTTSLGTSTSTFQVSLVPDGEPILFTTSLTGTIQIANQAKTFAGNNINPLTQTVIDVEVGTAIVFDGGNQGYTGAVQGTPPNNTLTISSYSGTTVNATGANSVDYYVGAMVLYASSNGIPGQASGLVHNTTYFVRTVTNNGGGSYTLTLSALPGSSQTALTISGGTGTQTLARIGVSLDKNIIHIPNSNFTEDDMIEYSFPVGGRFGVSAPAEEKLFYFVDTAYDAHNYLVNEDVGFKPIVATGGTILPDIIDQGRTWRVHQFTATGTSNFVVSSPGKEQTLEYLVVAGGGGGGRQVGGGGGAGGVLTGRVAITTAQTYPIVVGAGGLGAVSTPEVRSTNGGNSSAFGVTAIGGGGGASHIASQSTALNGGSGGGGSGNSNSQNTPGGSGTAGQGFAGGTGLFGNWSGGGGGGAGRIGQNADARLSGTGGNGGDGISSIITGTRRYYGGGGGGSWNNQTNATSFSIGGAGGGARGLADNGSIFGLTVGEDGQPNTGGGGGGIRDVFNPGQLYPRAGNGGSGVVIVRYPLTPPIPFRAPVATGGTISQVTADGYNYRVHAFTNTGASTFSVSDAGSWNHFEFLVIGGGGSGGGYVAGGGGGGGFTEGIFAASAQNYAITVGAGGAAGATSGTAGGFQGGTSSIIGTNVNITGLGGGGGGNHDSRPGLPGASGGGAGSTNGASISGGAATPSPFSGAGIVTAATYGFRGGNTTGPRNGNDCEGAGGGGAGGPGPDHLNMATGPGGPGRPSSILGQTFYFSGGGGGGGYYSGDSLDPFAGNGGIGGGGGGGTFVTGNVGLGGGFALNSGANGAFGNGSSQGPGGSGGANTGGGGGGTGHDAVSGTGGSGIVVIRYPIGLAT